METLFFVGMFWLILKLADGLIELEKMKVEKMKEFVKEILDEEANK